MRSDEFFTPCIPGMEPLDVPTTLECRVAPSLTVADLAAVYRVGKATIYRWTVQGRLPQPDYRGGRATWHPDLLPELHDKYPCAVGTFPRLDSPNARTAKDRHHANRVAAALKAETWACSRTKIKVRKPPKKAGRKQPTIPGHESKPPQRKKGGRK